VSELSPLAREFFETGKSASCPVYDMHGHMGPFHRLHIPNADADTMVRRMDRAGVKLTAFCHHGALLSPHIGNAANVEAVRRHSDRLRAYMAINANYPDIIERDLAGYDSNSDVYIGLKFLSDYHLIALTDDRNKPAWEFADAKGLIVLCHTWGGSRWDGAAQVRSVAERYPRARILMGHSCHGDWHDAIKLANDFANVYLDLCAVTDERGILERFVGECGSEKIVFGADFPWFNQHYYIGSVLGCPMSDDDRHNILHRNAERLLGIAS
jgi:predicted TIM-barrel fold metal-dependent hydrolase